jgi:hypothetical protein
MAKPKIKHTITKKEWNKKHKDFKTTIDGTPYIMMYDDKVGTHLVPVKIVDESVNEDFKSVVGKTVFSDGKGKLHFGYYKEDDSAYFVDYKTWAKLGMKDVSKGDTNKDKVVSAILKNQKQFNKKVDYNMWAKKTNPSFEQKMDWFIQNGWISNINKGGIKESIEEAKRGEFEVGDFVHFKSANKTGLVRGIKGDKVTILTMKGNYTGDIKDVQVLYQDNVNEGNFGEIDIMAKAARNFNEFVKEFYKDFRDFPKDKDTLKWLKSLYDGRSAFESVNELDINDPIMMKLRVAQMKRNQMAAKKINPDYKALKNATKIKALKKKRAEVMRDMEQEAEPEGGKIADRYGKLLNRIDNDIIKFGGNPMSESVNEVNYTDQTGMKSSVLKNNKVSSLIDFKLWRWAIDNSVKLYKGIGQNYMFTDGIMSLGVNLNKPSTIVKKWGKVDNKLKQIHLKNINENDGVYFKSYTAAIEAARAAALKKGFEVEEDEMFTKVGMNSKRPSVGKTTKVSLELIKNGKPQRKMLHIQVYGMKNGYELNSYIN